MYLENSAQTVAIEINGVYMSIDLSFELIAKMKERFNVSELTEDHVKEFMVGVFRSAHEKL